MQLAEHTHSMPINDWEEVKRRLESCPTTAELKRISWIHKMIAKSDKVRSDRSKIEELVKLPKDKLKLVFSPRDSHEYHSLFNLTYDPGCQLYKGVVPWVKIDSPVVLEIVNSYGRGLQELKKLEVQYKKYKSESDKQHCEEAAQTWARYHIKVNEVMSSTTKKIWWTKGICAAIVIATIIIATII